VEDGLPSKVDDSIIVSDRGINDIINELTTNPMYVKITQILNSDKIIVDSTINPQPLYTLQSLCEKAFYLINRKKIRYRKNIKIFLE
jgi:hypothetical protein